MFIIPKDSFMGLFPLCLCLVLCSDYVIGNEGVEMSDVDRIIKFGVYYSFEHTKAAFNNEEAEKQNVNKLIEEFERHCEEPKRVTNPNKAFPFIVIEGVHRTSRNIVGHKVARIIGAEVVPNPPRYMSVLSEGFPVGSIFRKAFFAIAIYGAACEARNKVDSTPVITNGHWLFQASFAIAKTFGTKPPPPTSAIYEWPKDLFKPDLVIFLNSPVALETPNEFKPVLVETFRRWRNPKVIELNTTKSYDELTQLAIQHINKEFGTQYSMVEQPEEQK